MFTAHTTKLARLGSNVAHLPLHQPTVASRRGLSRSFNHNRDYYQALGVPQTATQKEIKERFFSLCKQLHPDKNLTAELKEHHKDHYVRINEAYTVLGNPTRRQKYDQLRLNHISMSARFEAEVAAATTEEQVRLSAFYHRPMFMVGVMVASIVLGAFFQFAVDTWLIDPREKYRTRFLESQNRNSQYHWQNSPILRAQLQEPAPESAQAEVQNA